MLYKFLKNVLCKVPDIPTEQKERLILSIGQDLCRAVTGGEWTMPKHILLSVTLHHLFRSKQLLSLIHRLGHCEGYSYCMELETAHALAIEKKSTMLTPKIVKGQLNILFHSEWDNFNQNLTGMQGPTTCNTAAGIMLQETTTQRVARERPEAMPRTGRRSLPTDDHRSLPQMVVTKRNGPKISGKTTKQPLENATAFEKAMQIYTLWTFCRKASSLSRQTIPAFAGFVSLTGVTPERLTTIDFYPSITEPITEYNVVKVLLGRCEAATKEVGQLYTITTFDLGVCMKALPIIWNQPDHYKGHIILIGAFHTIMNYLNMLGHKMTGSGYTDILIEADLVTTGCLNKVLHGKKYSKSLWCLKIVSEAFERLLIKAFLDQRDSSDKSNADALESLMTKLDTSALKETLADESVVDYVKEFHKFQQRIKDGKLGETARFWVSFLDHARMVLMLIYAIKVNDFPLFHKCMADMADLFFSYGGQNYARYLAWFDVFITNIETSHPGASKLLKLGAISVARSLTPGTLSAVDKTMEETFMRFAKSRGGSSGAGLTGILQNYGAYQRWIRTSSERCRFYQATLEMAGIVSELDSPVMGHHKETRSSQVKKSESAVQRVISAVMGYTNPFTLEDKDKLYILSSGAPVPIDVQDDVMRAETVGRETKEKFIKERMMFEGDQEVEFFDKIKKLKLKKMDACNKKVKLTSAQGKIVQYREQGNIAFQILVKSQLLDKPIDIDELMKFSITPVPHSLGTPDGFLAKTDKAKLVHYLSDHLPEPNPPSVESTLYIEDGNAHIHSLKDLPPTFKGIALKGLDQLGRKTDFVFSTDMYIPNSIKSQERLRRGSGEKIILEGANTRKPMDFKRFLNNDDNKKQLFQLFLRIWRSPDAATRLVTHTAVIIVEGQAYKLTSIDGKIVNEEVLHEISSNQEETDTRVILYIKYARDIGYPSAVVRSPDSDIFVIIMQHAHDLAPIEIFFDTGSGSSRRLINITEIASDHGHEMCEAIMGFYCFTGEDCNSAFKGKGKVTPFKKLQKFPRYTKAFAALGNSWVVDQEVANELESFTCLMYGYPRLRDINTVRAAMLRKIVGGEDLLKAKSSNVDLSRLPPCKDSLTPHIKRVNYRVRQWKLAGINQPIIPDATAHGWTFDDGVLQPVWSEGPILPDSLHDLVDVGDVSESDESDEDRVADSDFDSESAGESDID